MRVSPFGLRASCTLRAQHPTRSRGRDQKANNMTTLYKLIYIHSGLAVHGDLTDGHIFATDPNSAIAKEFENCAKHPAKWVAVGQLI